MNTNEQGSRPAHKILDPTTPRRSRRHVGLRLGGTLATFAVAAVAAVTLSHNANADQAPTANETNQSVWITSPAEDATVTGKVTVVGHGDFFEGNVRWELYDQSGRVVDAGNVQAEGDATQDQNYSFTVTAPAGEYDLTVRDVGASATEGHLAGSDTVHLTVN